MVNRSWIEKVHKYRKHGQHTAIGKNKSTGGFTLAEVLITVTILIILMLITIPFIAKYVKSLRQTELDAKAETIYLAAQNELSKMAASGDTGIVDDEDTRILEYFSDYNYTGNGVFKMSDYPGDLTEEERQEQSEQGIQYYYVRSTELSREDTAASVWLGNDVIDETLLGYHWIVEYDLQSATVYAVFYSENRVDCAHEYAADFEKYNNTLRYRDRRMADGANVGYYGGAGAASSGITDKVSPDIDVIDGEELKLRATCVCPSGVSESLVFRLVLSDNEGNSYTKYYALPGYSGKGIPAGEQVDYTTLKREGRKYTLELILDSLNLDEGGSSQRFNDLYGPGSFHGSGKELVPGTQLTAEIYVTCPDNYLVDQSGYDKDDTQNSLFAAESNEFTTNGHNDTAIVTRGRHLQNLDADSRVSSYITTAYQSFEPGNETDRVLKMGEGSSWYETYAKSEGGNFYNGYVHGTAEGNLPNFKPIENVNLKEFSVREKDLDPNGEYRVEIAGLSEELTTAVKASGTGAAGLFGKITQPVLKLENLWLSGTFIDAGISGSSAGTSASALVGAVAGTTLTVNKCRVYLNDTDRYNKTNKDVWISGDYAGGLVGNLSAGSADVSCSFASTVIGSLKDIEIGTGNTISAAGLIGQTAAGTTAAIRNSYADSYLCGVSAAGLVGTGEGTTALDNCYSAGFLTFQKDGTGAGMVNGTAGTMNSSYTICSFLYLQEAENLDPTYYSTVKALSGAAAGVYYAQSASNSAWNYAGSDKIADDETSATLWAKLGGENSSFVIDTTGTVPYNLMNQGLTTYTWPRLQCNDHYGDWTAAFQNGALVYYEHYWRLDATGAKIQEWYGFYGANTQQAFSDEGLNADGTRVVVVGDGYGIAYDRMTLQPSAASVTVKMPVSDNAQEDRTLYTEEDIDLSTASRLTVNGEDADYYIYPLSKELCNTAEVNGAKYYLRAVVRESVPIAEGSSESVDEVNYYYFNPHFAKTVIQLQDSEAAVPALTAGTNISVRTPRQLYNLANYYAIDGSDADYRNVTAACIFRQERNIDYALYLWPTYTGATSIISQQQPVGTDTEHFIAEYNGYYNGRYTTITDVSFISGTDNYVGFIGYNEGTVQNTVIKTDYIEGGTNYRVQRTGNMTMNVPVYMGVLAGYNSGRINNCAAAGYYIAGSDGTIHAYDNSRVYVGGLLGGNSGTISKTSSDCPSIQLSANQATVMIGGFAGINDGTITDSYGIGNIDVVYSRGGKINISGFAGINNGRVSGSYCATSLTASGENCTSYGFAPQGGSVSGDCYYLSKGSYSYINHVYSFNFDEKNTSASPKSYYEMQEIRTSTGTTAVNSYNYPNTTTASKNFPYRAVVTGDNGLVHYGDWQDEVSLGNLGVFYWELEENGQNNGYHFAFVGQEVSDSGSAGIRTATNLCTAHEDGGQITAYGYGYYTKTDEDAVISLKTDGIAVNGLNNENIWSKNSATYNGTASSNIAQQMRQLIDGKTEYTFYAFNTQVGSEGNYLYLSSGDVNGIFELRYANSNNTMTSYYYEISPFFANALQYRGTSGKDGSYGSGIESKASDGTVSDYNVTPGSASANQYEIRSAAQLQYINWNSDKDNVTTLLDATVYGRANTEKANQSALSSDQRTNATATAFPYLGYAYYTSGTSTAQHHSANYYWSQTHDLNANGAGFTSIGSVYDANWGSGTNTSYVYATYFNGAYTGNSYVARNINISSTSQAVGLFGAVIGAKIDGLILYSDQGNTIEASANGYGWYNIGGIAGMALEGGSSISKMSGYGITNSAIAGYTIKDNRNNHGYGGANVGGFTGLCNLTISGCSAVTDIVIAPGYSNSSRNIRTGGFVGNFRGSSLSNCYSGGSIKRSYTSDSGSSNSSTKVHVGGISGGWFMRTAGNLSTLFGNLTAKPTIQNCYSYTDLSGANTTNDCAVCPIASNCNNENTSNNVTVTNCYYFAPSAVTYKNQKVDTGAVSVTYDQLANQTTLTSGSYSGQNIVTALNGGSASGSWDMVTTTEPDGSGGTAAIHGRYSFPGNDASLNGKDYPFPTVVRQKDLTYSRTVNVHYGRWPNGDNYWENARPTLDLFDRTSVVDSIGTDAEGTPIGGWTCGEYVLHSAAEISNPVIKISDTSYAEMVELSAYDASAKTYKLKLKGKKTGAVTVSVQSGESGSALASFTLEITASPMLSANPEYLILATDGASGSVNLSAKGNAKEYAASDFASWSIAVEKENFLNITTGTKGQYTIKADTGGAAMEEQLLTISFNYNYPGKVMENGSETETVTQSVSSTLYYQIYTDTPSTTSLALMNLLNEGEISLTELEELSDMEETAAVSLLGDTLEEAQAQVLQNSTAEEQLSTNGTAENTENKENTKNTENTGNSPVQSDPAAENNAGTSENLQNAENAQNSNAAQNNDAQNNAAQNNATTESSDAGQQSAAVTEQNAADQQNAQNNTSDTGNTENNQNLDLTSVSMPDPEEMNN